MRIEPDDLMEAAIIIAHLRQRERNSLCEIRGVLRAYQGQVTGDAQAVFEKLLQAKLDVLDAEDADLDLDALSCTSPEGGPCGSCGAPTVTFEAVTEKRCRDHMRNPRPETCGDCAMNAEAAAERAADVEESC